MIESQNVTRDQIKIEIKESRDEWLATAYLSERNSIMTGFIRFLTSKGTLKISNFESILPRKALDMGVSTKVNDANSAGTHGEGFKVAALVMLRKGFQVRYESAKFYWTFSFGGKDRRHLYCHLNPMKDPKITKAMVANSERLARQISRKEESHI